MSSLGTIWAELGLKLTKFDEGIRNAEAKIKQAEQKLEGLQKASERLSNMGKKLTMGVTLPLVGIGTASIKMSNDFNAAMANVATLIPGNTERVNELKRTVQDMAIEFGKRTGDIAGGLYQVISAFGDTADTVKILEINAKAATAGVATTTDAINLTSAVTKGYGDVSAEAVQKVSDLAFLTVKLGKTDFPELAASIGKVVPMAKSMGLSLEELFAVMATLTGVTGTAAEVSTQFRAILQGLQKPSKEMQAALEQLGFKSGTAALQTLGLENVLKKLREVTGNNADALANLWGQVEAGVAVQALTGGQAENLTIKLEAMKDAAGAMEEAFKEQTTGVNKAGFTWDQFKSKLEVAMLDIGEKLAPTFSKLIDYAMKAVDWFTNLDDSTQDLIIKFGMATAAIGPFLLILGKLGSSIVTLSAAKAVLTGSLIKGAAATTAATGAATGLNLAFVALAGKIALVVGALYLFKVALDDAKKGSDSIGSASGMLGYNMQNLQRDIDNVTTSLKKHGEEMQKVTYYTQQQIEAVQNYTDTVEAQRLKSQQAIQEQETQKRQLEEYKKKIQEWIKAVEEAGEKAKSAGQKIQDTLTAAMERLDLKAQIAQAKLDLLKAKMGENVDQGKVLEAEVDTLNSKYDLQKQKIETILQAYEQMKAVKGENAIETQRLYLELLQEQKVLQDLQKEISETRKEYNKLSSSVPQISRGASNKSIIAYYATKAYNEGRISAQELINAISGKKFANGGIIRRPVAMFDLATGQPAGIAGEAGSEAIVPLRSNNQGPIQIIVELDGRVIAEKTLPHMHRVMVLKGV